MEPTSRFSRVSAWPGSKPSRTYARSALRSWPIAAAARDALADDVADDQHQFVVGGADDVVPVTADLDVGAAGQVAAGHHGAGQLRQRTRQQAVLQGGGDPVLGLVELGVLQPHADQAGQLGQRGLLGAVVLALPDPQLPELLAGGAASAAAPSDGSAAASPPPSAS